MEKYGEIPKRFTAKWFEYVWEYYKWHIIVTVGVVAAVIYTWYTIANRPFYDLMVCFAGNSIMSEQADENLAALLEEQIADVNGDGEKKVKIMDLSLGAINDGEMLRMMEQKFYLQLQASDIYLYLISKERADRILEDSSSEGLFEETAGWCVKKGENEFFVGVENSDILKKSGIIHGELYAGMRNFVAGNNDEEDQALRNNALAAAKAILGE